MNIRGWCKSRAVTLDLLVCGSCKSRVIALDLHGALLKVHFALLKVIWNLPSTVSLNTSLSISFLFDSERLFFDGGYFNSDLFSNIEHTKVHNCLVASNQKVDKLREDQESAWPTKVPAGVVFEYFHLASLAWSGSQQVVSDVQDEIRNLLSKELEDAEPEEQSL